MSFDYYPHVFAVLCCVLIPSCGASEEEEELALKIEAVTGETLTLRETAFGAAQHWLPSDETADAPRGQPRLKCIAGLCGCDWISCVAHPADTELVVESPPRKFVCGVVPETAQGVRVLGLTPGRWGCVTEPQLE